MTTSPFGKYTHWKHTVFYIRRDIEVEVGEALEGTIHVAPNAVNHRAIDIELGYSFLGGRNGGDSLSENLMFNLR